MIIGIGRRVGALLLLPVVALLVGFTVPTTTAPPAATQAYSPPPREESPFSGPDAFCARSENRFPTVAPNDPSLRDKPVTVVMLAPPGTDATAPTGIGAAFAGVIDRCGGIGGRRFDLHTLAATGNAAVDCENATARLHAQIVVTLTETPAQQCIVGDARTILLTQSEVSNAELASSSGRLVATGSSEGIEQARLVDLVSSGRLDGQTVALGAGSDPGSSGLLATAQSVLSAARVRTGDLPRAGVVITPTVAEAASVLAAASAPLSAGRRRRPLDVYALAPASGGVTDLLQGVSGGDPASLLRSAHLYAFSPVTDPTYRAGHAPNAFSQMCNETYAKAVSKGVAAISTTTTTTPTPPLSATYLEVADVCLAFRTVARAAFAAGPDADQAALVAAFHRLPYLDQAASSGTPKPRPNQVVNAPVTRITQVVLLNQAEAPCSDTSSPTAVPLPVCWAPVPGWDDGGRAVNVPLGASAVSAGG